MNDEIWAPTPGCEGAYEASTSGRIRSMARVVPHGSSGSISIPERILKPNQMESGHLQVGVKMHGRMISKLVHRLVLETFVGEAPDGCEACHGNGDPTDNRLTNLRWDTRSANVRDAIKHGTHHQVKKVACPRGHALATPNLRPGHNRRCKACHLAQTAARHLRDRKGIEWSTAQIEEEADRRYAELAAGRIEKELKQLTKGKL